MKKQKAGDALLDAMRHKKETRERVKFFREKLRDAGINRSDVYSLGNDFFHLLERIENLTEMPKSFGPE